MARAGPAGHELTPRRIRARPGSPPTGRLVVPALHDERVLVLGPVAVRGPAPVAALDGWTPGEGEDAAGAQPVADDGQQLLRVGEPEGAEHGADRVEVLGCVGEELRGVAPAQGHSVGVAPACLRAGRRWRPGSPTSPSAGSGAPATARPAVARVLVPSAAAAAAAAVRTPEPVPVFGPAGEQHRATRSGRRSAPLSCIHAPLLHCCA